MSTHPEVIYLIVGIYLSFFFAYIFYFRSTSKWFQNDIRNPGYLLILVGGIIVTVIYAVIITLFLLPIQYESTLDAMTLAGINLITSFVIYMAVTYSLNKYNIEDRKYYLDYIISVVFAITAFVIESLSMFFVLQTLAPRNALGFLQDYGSISKFQIDGQNYSLSNSIIGAPPASFVVTDDVFYDGNVFAEVGGDSLSNGTRKINLELNGVPKSFDIVLSDKFGPEEITYVNVTKPVWIYQIDHS